MGFCSCTVKFLMVVFNAICSLAGIAILVVGVVMKTRSHSFRHLMPEQVASTSIALIILGVIIFMIPFFGCCGAVREDTCMVKTYGIALLVILICEIAVGITAFVYRTQVGNTVQKEASIYFRNYTANNATVDRIQIDWKCCGFDGPTDYNTSLPLSCCPKPNKICDLSHAYKLGCKETVVRQVKKNLKLIGAFAVGVGFVELLGVFCAFYVASSIKNHNSGYI